MRLHAAVDSDKNVGCTWLENRLRSTSSRTWHLYCVPTHLELGFSFWHFVEIFSASQAALGGERLIVSPASRLVDAFIGRNRYKAIRQFGRHELAQKCHAKREKLLDLVVNILAFQFEVTPL